jgi:hypothetical protein
MSLLLVTVDIWYRCVCVSLIPHFLLTRVCLALFPLQRHPFFWNCLYQRLMLLADGGLTLTLSPEGPLNRNNWFMLHKLQQTKFFLIQRSYFLFVTSRTEREGGSGIAYAIKTWISTVSFRVGNIHLRTFPKPLWPLEIAPVTLVHAVLSIVLFSS